jgi:hypothetical protein
VGGYFLGGYRFLVPLMPLAIVLTAAGIVQWLLVLESRIRPSAPGWARPAAVGAAAAAVALHGSYQVNEIRDRIEAGSGVSSPLFSLEPLRATRELALQWAALGRWIKAHAHPGDSMAGGAAGAAPYHAEILGIDTLGVCDREVARHGVVVGSWPGHQRLASTEYVLSRKPTFLFFTRSRLSTRPIVPKRDPVWEERGYVWVTAKIDREAHGAPETYYFHFQIREDRLPSLKDDPFAEAALPP